MSGAIPFRQATPEERAEWLQDSRAHSQDHSKKMEDVAAHRRVVILARQVDLLEAESAQLLDMLARERLKFEKLQRRLELSEMLIQEPEMQRKSMAGEIPMHEFFDFMERIEAYKLGLGMEQGDETERTESGNGTSSH